MTISPAWRVAGASVKGAIHTDDCSTCQDRFDWKIHSGKDGEILIAAIADGAGSSSNGGTGAKIACSTFLEELTKYLDAAHGGVNSITEDFGPLWLAHLQRLIKQEADAGGLDFREYSSTFVASVVGPDRAVFYQIGDGGVVYNDSESGEYRFAVEPEETEYVNVSSFVTDDDVIEHLKFATIEGRIRDIIMFSDGITGVAVDFATGRPFEPFLRPMMAPLRAQTASNGLSKKLEAFLDSPSIAGKSDDDKTIVLAANIGI